MTETELRSLITTRVLETIRFYNDRLQVKINPESVVIRFTLRGRTAGTATGTHDLNFNLILAATNFDEFIVQTVPHEVAHLFQEAIDPTAPPHGNLWKRIMRIGGFNPRRTHSYDTTAVRRETRTFPYTCACGPHPLSVRKHNNVLRGATYRCLTCRQILVLKP